MHKLLERQLRKTRRDGGEIDVDGLLAAASMAYEEADADRRRTERSISLMVAELDRSHGQLRDAIDVVPEGLILSDTTGRVVIWNQKFASLFPNVRKILKPGIPFVDVIRSEIAEGAEPCVDSWLGNRLRPGEPGLAGLSIQLSNSSWLRIEERGTCDGGIMTVFVDISELKKREEWFRLLFDHNPVPMWVHDRDDLSILAVNRAAADYFGSSSQDLLQKSILEFKDPLSWDETRARASSEVDFYSVNDAVYHSLDGRLLSADVFSRSIAYAGRKARIVSAVDTTERKRAEAAKEEALAEAERLRIQEQAAAQASKAKSSFLAVMSHEIRTPLNAVLGLATALLDSSLSDEQRLQIRTIYDAGDGLLTILNDILDYSKLEAGHVTLECNVFDVKDFVDTIISISEARAKEKGLTLVARVDRGVPNLLLGDAARLRQVVLNFLSNAIKFTTQGEVRLEVGVAGRKDGQPIVEWKISDTGIGIAEDQIARLFNDYVQADTSINRRFGGTGLGLAISRRIVSQMGGDVFITSKLGEGTVVGCRVPLAVSAVASSADRKQADNAVGNDLPTVIAQMGRKPVT